MGYGLDRSPLFVVASAGASVWKKMQQTTSLPVLAIKHEKPKPANKTAFDLIINFSYD